MPILGHCARRSQAGRCESRPVRRAREPGNSAHGRPELALGWPGCWWGSLASRWAGGSYRLCRATAQPLEIERHGATLERVRRARCALPAAADRDFDRVRGPIAVGLLRPRVVLPEGLAESISEHSLCDVLVHECAHVVRRDAWVGLLQRLAGALFWPHPLRSLRQRPARAGSRGSLRQLRASVRRPLRLRPHSAGTHCRCAGPSALCARGLGLLATRWTLADRVAGLIDPRRIPMTRTSSRTEGRPGHRSGRDGVIRRIDPIRQLRSGRRKPRRSQAEPQSDSQPTPNADFWNVEGIVVDEQGRPVGGATVRTMPVFEGPANVERQDCRGRHVSLHPEDLRPERPHWTHGRSRRRGTDGAGPSFDRRRAQRNTEPIRIVLKPSRSVTVRVKDAAGAPVPGATVEAAEMVFRTHADCRRRRYRDAPHSGRCPGRVGDRVQTKDRLRLLRELREAQIGSNRSVTG